MGEINSNFPVARTILIIFLTSFLIFIKWLSIKEEARNNFQRMIKNTIKPILALASATILYFIIFNHTPHGKDCIRSTSGKYMAERCFLEVKSYRSGDYQYVGRLFDAKSGRLLAEHTFITPVPDLFWSSGFSTDYPTPQYIGPSVNFSRGGEDGDGADISLPPSTWDKLLAMRPRLFH